jgi:hypothetical protein
VLDGGLNRAQAQAALDELTANWLRIALGDTPVQRLKAKVKARRSLKPNSSLMDSMLMARRRNMVLARYTWLLTGCRRTHAFCLQAALQGAWMQTQRGSGGFQTFTQQLRAALQRPADIVDDAAAHRRQLASRRSIC